MSSLLLLQKVLTRKICHRKCTKHLKLTYHRLDSSLQFLCSICTKQVESPLNISLLNPSWFSVTHITTGMCKSGCGILRPAVRPFVLFTSFHKHHLFGNLPLLYHVLSSDESQGTHVFITSLTKYNSWSIKCLISPLSDQVTQEWWSWSHTSVRNEIKVWSPAALQLMGRLDV